MKEPEDSFKIEQNEKSENVNNSYLDDFFGKAYQAPAKFGSAIGPQRFNRARIAMFAHPEGSEPEPQVTKKEKQSMGVVGKSILATMLASVFFMTFAPDAAFAARSGGRSGGRMGGRAPSMARSAPRP